MEADTQHKVLEVIKKAQFKRRGFTMEFKAEVINGVARDVTGSRFRA